MDARLVKIVVGLALESAIVHRRDTSVLVSLYSAQDVGRIREIHDKLIESDDHPEREAAIWLELALEQGRQKSKPEKLAAELRMTGTVLYSLIRRSGGAQQELNYWMNYISNAAQFIMDGFWIDAKIFLSKALQCSLTVSVEELKSEPWLRYEVDVLQRATASYFEEIKGYPLRLSVPEERLDALLSIQGIMLEMMQNYYRGVEGEENEYAHKTIHGLSSAIRHLIEDGKEIETANRELTLVLGYLEGWLNIIVDKAKREQMNINSHRIKEVVCSL